jgi:hypothetical protein
MTTPVQTKPNADKNAPPPLPAWPFPVGVLGTENQSDYSVATVLTTAAQPLPDVKVQPDGWLRGMWIDILCTTTAGNVATTVFTADGALAAINSVLFRDTGGEQIFGPFNSYDWATTNKFGGYQAQGDPRADNQFKQTAGTGAGTSFHLTLYIPLEISSADSLGDVENRSENSIYRVSMTLEASGVIYSTAPTAGSATVTITTTQDSYTEPVAAMSLSGRPVAQAPPAPGSLQYWKQENPTVPAAAFSALITNGIGNGYRNIIFKLTDNASPPSRSAGDANFPDPFEVTLGTTRTRLYKKATWKDKMARQYQLTNTTADTAKGLENGVYVMNFNQDVSLLAGDEARRRYQRTKTGNTYKTRGTYGGAGVLYITSNYVVPKDNNFSQVVA